jgi:hypothetical protein
MVLDLQVGKVAFLSPFAEYSRAKGDFSHLRAID